MLRIHRCLYRVLKGLLLSVSDIILSCDIFYVRNERYLKKKHSKTGPHGFKNSDLLQYLRMCVCMSYIKI